MTRSAEAGRVMKVQPVYARLEQEQYEWLRRYCFENRVAHAEVIREALEMFREAKEGTTILKAKEQARAHLSTPMGGAYQE